MTWQPIETAPEAGDFLVYMPSAREGRRIQAAQWHPNVKIIGGTFGFDNPEVTHWMPLPPPPEDA